MKTLLPVLLFVMAFAVGCATIKPETLQETPRDLEVWEGLKGPNEETQEDKFSVAVVVDPGEAKSSPDTARNLEGAVIGELSRFDFFEIAERGTALGALLGEDVLSGAEEEVKDGVPKAEYIVVTKILGFAQSKSETAIRATGALVGTAVGAGTGGLTGVGLTGTPQGATRGAAIGAPAGAIAGGLAAVTGNLSVDFRFYEVATKKMIMDRSVEVPCSSHSEGDVNKAIREAARQFALELCLKYAPPTVVMESRGNGKVVRISMGRNYGLQKGSYIGFYYFRDLSHIQAGRDHVRTDIGQGKVIILNEKDAWVQVDHYKKSQVKLGHFAALKEDQEAAETWKDKINVFD